MKTVTHTWSCLLTVMLLAFAGLSLQAAELSVPAPYPTIQDAITAAQAGDTIHIAAGTYAVNLTIPKAITLLGPNAGVNPNTQTRGDEAILVPAVNDTTNGKLLDLQASGIVIDGLTLNGDSADLTGGLAVNGRDINTAFGIATTQDVSGITIQNTVIKNVVRGISLVGANELIGKSGNYLRNNLLDNMASFSPNGRGIVLANSFYAEVSGNVLTRVRIGIQVDTVNAAGAPAVISNNRVTSANYGIWLNNHLQNATSYTVQSNTLLTNTGSRAENYGLAISSIQGTVTVDAINNTVSGASGGVLLWNCPTSNHVTITGGTLVDNNNGIYAYNSVASADSDYTVSGVTITDSRMAGVMIVGSSSTLVRLILQDGVIVSGGAKGARVLGGSGMLAFAGPHAADFSGQSDDYISLETYNGVGPGDVDATEVTFAGVNGAVMTLPAAYAVEDKMTHKLDNLALGVVWWKANHVFVTRHSGSVQRGAIASSNGGTVHVMAGTFAETVTISKPLTLIGAGNGTDPANATLIVPSSGEGCHLANIAGSVTLRDIRVSGAPAIQVTGGSGPHTLEGVALEGSDAIRLTNALADVDAHTVEFVGAPTLPEKEARVWHDFDDAALGHVDYGGVRTRVTAEPATGQANSTLPLFGVLKTWDTATPLDARPLTYSINDVTVGSATTGSNGRAVSNANIGDLLAGYHTIRVEFPGDDTYQAAAGTATLTVEFSPTGGLALTLNPSTITADETTECQAQAHNNGSTWDMTALATWSITPAAGGSFDGTNIKVYHPHTAGQWTMQASYVNRIGTAVITVTHGAPVGLTITPLTPVVPSGTTQAFTATATDTYGNTWDASTATGIVWAVNDADGGSFTGNVFTASKAGNWVVSATYAGLHASRDVIVTTGSAIALTLTPSTATVSSGGKVAYTAIVTDIAGNSWDVSTDNETVWEITPGAGGQFTNGTGSELNKKVYTAQHNSPAGTPWVIKATYDGAEGTANLTVEVGVAVALKITPATQTISANQTASFNAIATDAAGNSWNVSTDAGTVWSINRTAGGSFSDGVNTKIYTPQYAGNWTVTATFAGFTATASLSVMPGNPVSLSVTPAITTVKAGSLVGYLATVTDAYGNSWNVSNAGNTIWTIDVAAGGTFTDGTGGYVGRKVYTTSHSGTWTVQTEFTGLYDTCTLTVNYGDPIALTLAPGKTSITADETVDITATAADMAGNTWNATGATTWNIDSNAGGSFSYANGVETYHPQKAGTWRVQASYNGVTKDFYLTVTPGLPTTLTAAPATGTVESGSTITYTATGKDAKNNTFDVSTDSHVTWYDGAADGQFSTDPATKNVYTAGAMGTVTIYAVYTPASGPAVTSNNCTLTVTPNRSYDGNVLCWDANTRRLTMGAASQSNLQDVTGSGWYNLSMPVGAQVYIKVTNTGNLTSGSVTGEITHYAEAGGHAQTDPAGGTVVTCGNKLYFKWIYSKGVISAVEERSYLGTPVPVNPTIVANYYQSYEQTLIGTDWYRNMVKLTHKFLSVTEIIVGTDPVNPPR